MTTFVTERRRWSTAAACLIIVLAGVGAYANSLRVPFLFDDLPSIVENSTIRSLSNISQVLSPPSGGETVGGRPILNLSFAVNYAVSGEKVWSWHAVNILLHVLAGLCLFGIVRRTLALPTDCPRTTAATCDHNGGARLRPAVDRTPADHRIGDVSRATGGIAGWLIPAVGFVLFNSRRGGLARQGLAVRGRIGVPGRNGHERSDGRGADPGRAVRLGFSGRNSGEHTPGTPRVLCNVGLDVDPAGGPAARINLARRQCGVRTTGSGAWDYARTQFGFIVLYLKLCFWPDPLVLDYGDQIAAASAKLFPQAGVVFSLAAATLAAFCYRRFRPLGFLGACFFCILAPSSSIVPVVTQTGAEHRMYLPLAAVITLVVFVIAWLWNRISTAGRPLWQTAPPMAALVTAALALGSATANRNTDYGSVASIWSDTVKKCPENWRAQYSLGCSYYFGGELERALESYDRSIALNSNEFAPLQYHGFTCLKLRNFKSAQADFLRCLELNPRDAATHNNLALALAGADELELALKSATEAVRLSPANPGFRRFRGSLLTRLERHVEALQEYSNAVYLEPQSPRGLSHPAGSGVHSISNVMTNGREPTLAEHAAFGSEARS